MYLILFRKLDASYTEEFDALVNSVWYEQEVVYQYRDFLPVNCTVIGRYSVLPYYDELQGVLSSKGSSLINDSDGHKYVADISNWYMDLKESTPRTWFQGQWGNLPDNCSFVVKGLINSRKHEWNRRMFAATRTDVQLVVSSLLDDCLLKEQGLCVRQYVPLKTFDIGINGLPITNEWRYFFIGNKLVAGGYYWANFPDIKPEESEEAIALAKKVATIVAQKSNFFVVDVAQTETGEWILIELNDAQMSGLCTINPKAFYENLYNCITYLLV